METVCFNSEETYPSKKRTGEEYNAASNYTQNLVSLKSSSIN